MEKFFRESGFPIFGRKFYVARQKLAFWPLFCNCISDFQCCILVLLDYFDFSKIQEHLHSAYSYSLQRNLAAFHRQIHSGKNFSELGSIGNPPLTTNGSAEGLDHLSVKRILSPRNFRTKLPPYLYTPNDNHKSLTTTKLKKKYNVFERRAKYRFALRQIIWSAF